MKKTNQNNQSSSFLEQAQSIDWQKQLPFIIETLLKSLTSSSSQPEVQLDASHDCSITSSDVKFRGNSSEAIEDYSSVTPQIQKTV